MSGPIKVADAMTPQWFEARNHSIGASEIAAAAGLSPYDTPLALYKRKRGELPPVTETDPMRLGKLLEPVVKAEFLRSTGLTLSDFNPPMFRHPSHEPITATPDGIIDAHTLLETKTASWRLKSSWGSENTDDVPTQYLCQCQQQMAVCGADVVHLAVLFDGADLKTFRVMRNDQLIKYLILAGLELWERIKDGRAPDPDWSHPSTPALVRELHDTINETRIELDSEISDAWGEYETLGKQVSELNDRRDMLKAKVTYAIGENYAGLLPDGRMVRRKLIQKKPFTVTPEPYIELRAVKS